MPDRETRIAELISAGMDPEAATDYVDRRYGWAHVPRVRPYHKRLAERLARQEGVSMGTIIGKALEEYEERRTRRWDVDIER